MRILFIGDIVGKPGRHICTQAMRGLRAEENLDLVVANAENIAGGSGLTPEIYHELIGRRHRRHHDGRSRLSPPRDLLRSCKPNAGSSGRRTIRPPPPAATSLILRTRQQVSVAVFALLGRVFMPPVDCPFQAADRVLAALPPDVRVILVDFHAEATSDKQLMGRHLDGRVSAVLGTHTHVPTADEQNSARRHGLPVRRRHDRPAREHPRPPRSIA